MARIRSLHPGQWTDEDFVACSMAARLLALGLRNEADDNGVFEWKPLAIKMRLFPADAVDVAVLLDELSANNQVRAFEDSGKRYGVIRNFRRWQRPDKPKSWLPLPDDLRPYAGLVDDKSAISRRPVGDQSAKTSAEVGCRRKEEDVGGNPDSEAPRAVALVSPATDEPDLLAIPESIDKRKATRLPVDWTLPDDWRRRAIDARHRHGLPAIDLDLEAEKFANYWHARSGQGGTKRDWAATWQNWCLNAGSRGGAGLSASPDWDAVDRAIDKKMGHA